jgi:signal peptidase complex subunit 2
MTTKGMPIVGGFKFIFAVEKTNICDTNSIKKTLDASVSQYFTNEGYEVDNSVLNLKMLLGFICCILGAISHYSPPPYPQNVPILIGCVVSYYIISGIMQYMQSYVEKDIILWTKAKVITDGHTYLTKIV